MFATSFLIRLAKTILVSGIALLGLLIVVNNITDYYTNYFFVAHVLKMDTVFPDSNVQYRSLHDSFLFHAGYIVIILMEFIMAFCCLKGGWQMIRQIKANAQTFHAAKNWAVAGIIVGILVWFIGFQVIGGEWFAMWQSPTWNGLEAAERMLSVLILVLILLHFKDQ